MSSGITHDRVSLFVWPGWVLLVDWLAHQYPLLGLMPVVASLSYIVGFLWLPPDMDLGPRQRSRPGNRWGPFIVIWHSYQRSHPHRGVSHAPLWGSFERCLYVGWAIVFGGLCGYAALAYARYPDSWQQVTQTFTFITLPPFLFSFWVGVEAACLVHLFCDNFPVIRKM